MRAFLMRCSVIAQETDSPAGALNSGPILRKANMPPLGGSPENTPGAASATPLKKMSRRALHSATKRSTQLVSPSSAAMPPYWMADDTRSEEHTSELQSRENLVCRLLLEKKK